MDKPNFYAILTAPVRYDNRLKAAEKILYAEITALSNVEGYCFAGNGYFAELYGVDKRTIQRWLMDLKKYGYVQILSIPDSDGSGADRKITPVMEQPVSENNGDPPHDKNVVPPMTELSCPPRQNCHAPHDKNVTHNNTSNNTTRKNKGSSSAAEENKVQCMEVLCAFAGKDERLQKDLKDFWDMREAKKKTMNIRSCSRLLSRLNKLTQDAKVQDRLGYMHAMLDKAIDRGWTDVYAVDDFVDHAPVHMDATEIDRPRMVTADTDILDLL